MTTYDNTNSGTMFVNDKKTMQNHPDYKGKINIRGEWFWLSGWKKTGGGKQFVGFQIEEMTPDYQQKYGGVAQQAPQAVSQYAPASQAASYAPPPAGSARAAPTQQFLNDQVPF